MHPPMNWGFIIAASLRDAKASGTGPETNRLDIAIHFVRLRRGLLFATIPRLAAGAFHCVGWGKLLQLADANLDIWRIL